MTSTSDARKRHAETPHQIIETETGSTYELDHANRRIRRLGGTHSPTNHQGPDGEWRTYGDIVLPTMGCRMLIEWAAGESTLTSTVTDIQTKETA